MIRPPHNPTPYDDDWEDQPGQGAWYQWGVGVGVAVLLIGYGSRAVMSQSVAYNQSGSLMLTGHNAMAYGIAWIAAGVFVHCHYFWGNLYNQAWWAVLGKIVAGGAFIGGLVYVLINNGIFGRR